VGGFSATAACGRRVRLDMSSNGLRDATLTPPGVPSDKQDRAAGQPRACRPLPSRPCDRVGVVVADSHPLYLESLERNVRLRPEFELLGVAEGPELLDVLEATRPRVLVVDHTTIGIDRRELLGRAGAASRVLLICTDPEPEEIYASMADGASGYLAKDCPRQELCETIAALARGEERLGVSIQPAIASAIRLRESVPRDFLTDREREILLLMCDGLSAPAIGERVCVSLPTVKTHQHHIFEKLGATERAMAVAIALRRGLIE